MRYILLLTSLVLLTTSLFAQRIMITKTSNKGNLREIHTILQRLHVKMYFKKTKNYYVVYSKRYDSPEETHYKLKKIQRYFPSAYIQTSKEKKIHTSKGGKKKELYNYFIALHGAKSSITTDDINITSTSGYSYSLEAGYYFTEYLYVSGIYEIADTKDITLSNFYGSLNYNYKIIEDFNIFAGVLLGHSKLTLNIDNATPSTSLAFGGAIGVSYDVLGFIPISLTYQLLSLKHKIIYDTTLERNFTRLQSFQLGLGYKF